MYGRVRAFVIDQLLWNLVTSTQKGLQWTSIERCDFRITLIVNLLALQIIEPNMNFKGGCAFIYNLLYSLNNSNQS